MTKAKVKPKIVIRGIGIVAKPKQPKEKPKGKSKPGKK